MRTGNSNSFFSWVVGLLTGILSLLIIISSRKRSHTIANSFIEAEPAFPHRKKTSFPTPIPNNLYANSNSQKAAYSAQDGSLDTTPITMDTTWTSTTKYLVGTGLFFFIILVLYVGRSVIPLIILGGLIAFTVEPVTRIFQDKLRFRRGFAISVTYLLALLVILLIPVILIPSIINAIDLVSGIDLQTAYQNFTAGLAEFAARVSLIPLIGPLLSGLFTPLLESLGRLTAEQPTGTINLDIAIGELVSRLASTLGVLVRPVGAVVSAMVAVFFALFISIYLSFDGHKIRASVPRMLPPVYKKEIEGLLHNLAAIWEAFLHGQITLMVLVGLVVWLGTSILGLPQPVFFGFLSGMLEMIPSLGPLLAFIPAVTVALLFGSTHLPISNLTFCLLVAGFYLFVQFMENQFIVPRVLGKAVDLHPLVVLVGALAAGSQFGILGIFLAAPTIATAKAIFIYLYDKILEVPAVPPIEEKKTLLKDIQVFAHRVGMIIAKPFRRSML